MKAPANCSAKMGREGLPVKSQRNLNWGLIF
jgi:hypothetical protein